MNSMFKLTKELENGVKLLSLNQHKDDRGDFLKIFNATSLQPFGDFISKEVYITSSNKDVVRGLHFQTPPYDHVKLVTCLTGSVLDVTIDLRSDSNTYGKISAIELKGDAPTLLWIPKGYAHGFYP